MRAFVLRAAAILLLASATACTSLPPARPATNVSAIAGKWGGTITSAGRPNSATTTIASDGTYETIVPAFSNPGPRFVGKVWVQDGKYRFKSDTTGRTGTMILHEGEGRRVLVTQTDDGSASGEATPAK